MRYCVVQGASGSFLVAQSLCTRLVRATESEEKEEEEEAAECLVSVLHTSRDI